MLSDGCCARVSPPTTKLIESTLTIMKKNICQRVREEWRCSGLIVRVLTSLGSSSLTSSPGGGHCAVFLQQTLHSHSASLHAGVL